MTLQINKLQKAYGDKDVLLDISFFLTEGERVGIVGDNGCGKSTLLQLIAGHLKPDGGEIYLEKDTSIGVLEQNGHPDINTEETWNGLEQQHLKFLQAEPGRIAQSASLSGGEQTKLALSRLLSANPHLLLLDEPTNNLDYEGINTLIELLYSYFGSILVVSHDRYFLDTMVTRILEIEDGKIVEYNGNYSYYREEKERIYKERLHRYQDAQREQKRIDGAIRELKQWSSKAHRESTKVPSGEVKFGFKEFHRAKAKRTDQRVKSQLKRLEKLKQSSEDKPNEEKTVYFTIQDAGNRGKRILQATALEKSFGDTVLFENSDFTLARGEKGAVFGPNGCGKTTFIRMVQGLEPWDSGDLWVSPSSEPYILPQTFMEFPADKTVLEYLNDTIRTLTGRDRTMLNNMGLTARHLSQKISSLSFGEQMKLKLAEPILEQRDFIILDEPTNHLDLHAREMLEETLSHYNGTLLAVSHDIYFLQKICDKVFLFEDRQIKRLELPFSEYLERLDTKENSV